MREFLARRVATERDPDAAALAYRARVGRYGSGKKYLVLEDVRTDAAGEPVTDHVWLPHTQEFSAVRPGDQVRFTAYAQPYVKRGEVGALGVEHQRVVDYQFSRPRAVEKIARQDMSAYQMYLMMKQADAMVVPAAMPPAAAPKVSDPARLDLRVLGGDTLAHLQAQTHGYIPVATLQDNAGGTTHIVYSHRRGWNDARKMLYGDPSKFTVQAHGLVAAGEGTPPGGRVVPVVYGR